MGVLLTMKSVHLSYNISVYKANIAREKQSHQLSHKDETIQVTCLVNCSVDVRAGRWWRICRGESRPLNTNATEECLAYHTESIKQICVDVRSSNANSHASQAIMVWPCLSSWYVAEGHTTRNSQGNVSVITAAQSCSSFSPTHGGIARLSTPRATVCKFHAHRN